jgi:hypothetical protein
MFYCNHGNEMFTLHYGVTCKQEGRGSKELLSSRCKFLCTGTQVILFLLILLYMTSQCEVGARRYTNCLFFFVKVKTLSAAPAFHTHTADRPRTIHIIIIANV